MAYLGSSAKSATVSRETHKTLLGHVNGNITTHYSAIELDELLKVVQKIDNRDLDQTWTLTEVRITETEFATLIPLDRHSTELIYEEKA